MTLINDRFSGVESSVAIKAPVKVATTASITLSGAQTIDGVPVVAGDRVLVKDQTDATENGIWVAATAAWSRAKDCDGARDLDQGTFVYIKTGQANSGVNYQLATSNPIIGETSLLFIEDTRTEHFGSRNLLRDWLSILNANGVTLSDGKVIWAEGLAYKFKVGATEISDLPNLVPVGNRRLEHHGAIGDGIADDTDAINEAFAAGDVICLPNKSYMISDRVFVPSNRIIDMSWSPIIRTFQGTAAISNSDIASDPGTNVNITLKNISLEDDGLITGRGDGMRMSGVTGLEIDGFKLRATGPGSGVVGAWALFVSGKDISMKNIDIDNFVQNQWADGVHFGYIENLVMTDFRIKAGDDAVALYHLPEAWSYGGEDKPSKNIKISDGYCESNGYSALKVGNWPSPNLTFENAVWQNVNFSDITIGPVGGNPVILEDYRTTAEIGSLQNDVIEFSNIHVVDENAQHLITAYGNPDIFDAANYAQHNFGRVRFQNVTGTNIQSGTVEMGGIDRLEFDGCNFRRELSSGSSNPGMDFRHMDEMLAKNCLWAMDDTGSCVQLRHIVKSMLLDCHLSTDASAFRAVNLELNTDHASSLWVIGGSNIGSQRAIDDTGTGTIQDLVVAGVLLDASVLTDAVSGTPTGLSIWKPLDEMASSDGGTGGSGSAGSGNQYVELSIGGTVYKVLHDGAV